VPTRTAKLYAGGPAAGAFVTAINVPAGKTYIVKAIAAYNTALVADNITIGATGPGGAIRYWFNNTPLAALTAFDWAGFFVMAPGDLMLVYSLGGVTAFWLSGTKLDGVA